jgi:hypothetical protein
METVELPSVEKIKLPKATKASIASCCVLPTDKSACCTPNEIFQENNGECCQQPEDGTACCNK